MDFFYRQVISFWAEHFYWRKKKMKEKSTTMAVDFEKTRAGTIFYSNSFSIWKLIDCKIFIEILQLPQIVKNRIIGQNVATISWNIFFTRFFFYFIRNEQATPFFTYIIFKQKKKPKQMIKPDKNNYFN